MSKKTTLDHVRNGRLFKVISFEYGDELTNFLLKNPSYRPIKYQSKQVLLTEIEDRYFDSYYHATCPNCGKETRLKINSFDLLRRTQGNETIQNCFPYLNKEQREVIKSGYCHECQMELFFLNYDTNGRLKNLYF